jgi:hypothetical protein
MKGFVAGEAEGLEEEVGEHAGRDAKLGTRGEIKRARRQWPFSYGGRNPNRKRRQMDKEKRQKPEGLWR